MLPILFLEPCRLEVSLCKSRKVYLYPNLINYEGRPDCAG